MRIWSIHPKYLDNKALLGLWRETLLAQKVLENKTKGYKSHPQIIRFKNQRKPLEYISRYLTEIIKEAKRRGYNFDESKITYSPTSKKIDVTIGQFYFEFDHLLKKLEKRDPIKFEEIKNENCIKPHPLFNIVSGEIEFWEKV